MKRDDFLNNLRQSLKTSYLPEALQTLPPRPAPDSFHSADLLASFVQEASALNAQVYQPKDEADAYETLLGIFAQNQASDFITWGADSLPLPKLAERLQEQGFSQHDFSLPTAVEDRRSKLAQLSPVPIGITGTIGALADTGSIAVKNGTARGRLASLLPPIHVALLKADQIVPSIDHLFYAQGDNFAQASNLVLITGPSRTADIELTLTIGVHGPKELHIIIV